MNEPGRQGFFNQFRAQHWAVKIIIVVVGSIVTSPFLAIGSYIAGSLFGGGAVALLYLGGLVAAGWFVFTSPSHAPESDVVSEPGAAVAPPPVGHPAPAFASDRGAPRRYCESCGDSFARGVMHCPSCNAEWRWPVFENPAQDIARYLNLIVRDYEDGFLDRSSYNRMRAEYERRLLAARPAPEPEPEPEVVPVAVEPAPVAEVPGPVTVPFAMPPIAAIETLPVEEPAAAITPTAEELPVAAITPEPTEVREAFGTPVAAITPEPQEVPVAAASAEVPIPAVTPRPAAAIPQGPSGPSVGDMGRAMLGWAAERQADILLYVGAFMLCVAAVIFMAYQGEALSGGIRFTVLTVYALAFLLGGVWLHRWERVKEAAPVFLALGAILVPIDFLALRTQVLGQDQVSNELLWLLGSTSCAVLYFVLALRGYGRMYFAPAIPSALVAWGSLGAVLHLPDAWFGPWYLAVAGPGYVWGIANLERNALARWVTIGAMIIGAPALAFSHILPAITGEDRFAAPAGYAVFGAAAAAGLRWRKDTVVLALLPAIFATAGGTLAWAAFDISPEWRVPFVAAAGLGYLVVAHFEDDRRARAWAAGAVVSGLLALVLAHMAAAQPDPADSVRGVLPVTYALVFIGASGAYGRWRWFEAAAVMPPASAMVVLTAAWASAGVAVEWYGAFAGIAPLGYLALAFLDRPDRRKAWQFAAASCALIGPAITHAAIATDASADRWALASAYAPVLITASIASGAWRFNWRLAPGALPPLVAMTALSVVWAQWDLAVEWYAAFAAAAALGYLALAWLDRPNYDRMWASFAGVTSAGAIAGAHITVLDSEASRWALPVAYGLVLLAASAAFAKWRFDWSVPPGFLPPLAAMTGLSFSWAQWNIAPEWYPAFAAAATLGYLAVAWFEKPSLQPTWAGFSLVFGFASIAGAHLGVLEEDASRWALFAPYLECLASAAIVFARWRFAWRLAPGLIPPLAGMTALSFAWAQWDLQPEWYASFAAAAALGYVVVAWLDRRGQALVWAELSLLFGAAAVGGAHLAVLEEGANRWALFSVYVQTLAGASAVFALWRFTWRLAPALIPPLAGMTALSFAWARWDLAVEWYPAFIAAAALGYVVVAWLDRRGMAVISAQFALLFGIAAVSGAHLAVLEEGASRWALFSVYVQALAGSVAVFVLWRFTWRLGPALVPVTAAMTALSVAWARWDIAVEWYPAFALAAALGYLALAAMDDPKFARGWGSIFGLGAFGALIGVQIAVVIEGANQAALPVAYAMTFTGVAVSFWKWRWFESGAAIPAATAMTAVTAGWAWFDLQPEWYGAFAAATSFGYLALARFDFAERRAAWWSGALAGPVLGIALAHAVVALDGEAVRYAVPVTYGITLLAASVAFSVWRFGWRLAPATIPALASATALSFAWARWDPEFWWWPAFVVPAAYGYIALALADQKVRARDWLVGSALACGLGVALAQGLQLDVLAEHRALPLAYGEALLAVAFIVGWWRFETREAIVVLPPLAAAFGATLGWAEFDMRLDWLTAWTAAAGAGYFVPAYFEQRYRDGWRFASVVFGAVALLGAHGLAFETDPVRWQLPVSYAVLLLAWAWHAIALRDETVLGPPLLASVFGAATLWALGISPEWWAYPALAVAVTMAAGEGQLRKLAWLKSSLWLYLLVLASAATIAVLPVNYTHPAHALATQLVSAALFFVAAWRSDGSIVRLFQPGSRPIVIRGERIVLIQAGFAFLFGAAASANGVLELAGADRAWALAAVAFAGWAILALPILRRDAIWTFAPVGLAGMVIAASLAVSVDGVLTGVLAIAALGPIVAYFGVRRWALLGIANSFLLLAVWAGWRWQEADLAYLPLGFALLAVAEWAVLTRLRKYSPAPGESDLIIAYLSWGPWLIAGFVAGLLLSRKQQTLEPGVSLVTTAEWALAAAVLAMAAAAVTGEGLRFWKRWVWTGGSVGLLAALLMGIATFEPSNVQAYTAPIGAYLILIALTFRSSPELIGKHILVHEGAMVLGALLLVLPPAEQSFAPGGGYYGLELIGISLALLLVGLLLHGRWLVAAGVATMTVTAMRMVTGGLFSTPYWLLLGIGGTALIGFGLLVLLERERWDRFRHRVVEWWQETAAKGPPTDTPTMQPS